MAFSVTRTRRASTMLNNNTRPCTFNHWSHWRDILGGRAQVQARPTSLLATGEGQHRSDLNAMNETMKFMNNLKFRNPAIGFNWGLWGHLEPLLHSSKIEADRLLIVLLRGCMANKSVALSISPWLSQNGSALRQAKMKAWR